MDRKTREEWIVMRYFREKFPGFPKGKLVKGESPDFRLWISKRKFIGIELTQVHPDNTDNAGRSNLSGASALGQVTGSLLAKEEKVRLYRSDCPFQLWLIIFARYSEPAAMNKVTAGFDDKRIVTSYDRVFLFDLESNRVLQLV